MIATGAETAARPGARAPSVELDVTLAARGRRRQTAEGELPPGASLGRYILLSRLGAGGMGVVYAAYATARARSL